MAEARRAPQTHQGRVVRTERITPGMQRIVLGGPGLAAFSPGAFTDLYVKLVFPAPGADYPEPFDLGRIRAELPRDRWPSLRSITVRAWDAAARELTLDFVDHGSSGLAGPWAAAAQEGDTIRFAGPGGGYAPSADAGLHLLAGDASALPAIAASVEQLPRGAVFHALVEVDGPAEEQDVRSPDGQPVTWVHRSGPAGAALADAVRALDLPADGTGGAAAGGIQAFVHGEAGFVRGLRRHLRLGLGIPRERLSVSGYWRLGHDDESWRAAKPAWNAEVEAEQDAAAAN